MIVAGSTTPEQFQPGERVPAVSLPDGSRAMVDGYIGQVVIGGRVALWSRVGTHLVVSASVLAVKEHATLWLLDGKSDCD